ncbi:MAG: hypothetical protein LBH93_00880 [Chitinispirillales bacterium]|nr:hypothetical protein [Chitinispirillales bacterium]
MDAAAIAVKIVGLALFLFTARSVYRHFKGRAAQSAPSPAALGEAEAAPAAGKKPAQQQSKVEHALNAFLLYAWFVFMTALSLGMIVNN